MKNSTFKIFAIAIIAFLTSINADAYEDISNIYKTKGRYIGINLNLVKSSVTDTAESDLVNVSNYNSTRKVRGGINYSYAFNYNNFFVAPEVFLDIIENTNQNSSLTNDKLTINTRYGIKGNVGYDFVNQKFSPYLTFGRAAVEYESNKRNDLNTIIKTGTRASSIYGIGSNFEISENFIANIEYNRQRVDLDQGTGAGRFKTEINSVKFGIAYNF